MPRRLPTTPAKAVRPVEDEGDERLSRIVHLTQRFVDALKPAEVRYRLTDSRVYGLSIRVERSGNHQWQVRIPSEVGSRQFWKTIAPVADMSLSVARKAAGEYRRTAAESPNARLALDADRAQKLPFEELAPEWMEKYVSKKKPGTQASYQEKLDLYILPYFQRKKLKEMDSAAICAWHQAITAKGVCAVQKESTRKPRPAACAADRALGTLTSFFKYAVSKQWVRSNPTRDVAHNGDHKIHRPLDADARRKVGQAIREMMLDGSANAIYLMAIQLSMCSSLRREALTTLEWREVHLEQRYLSPVTKTTTQLDPQRIPMGAAAFSILRGIPRIADSPYVFPGKDPRRPMGLSTLNAVWCKVRERAGIHAEYPEMDRYGNLKEKAAPRLHDLRHTKTAKLAETEENPMIGAVVGIVTTETITRYAGPVKKKVAQANEPVELAFAEDLGIEVDPEYYAQGPTTSEPAPPPVQIIVQVGSWPPRGKQRPKASAEPQPAASKARPTKGNYPPDDELQQRIRERPLTQVAKEIGVSDVALRKWCVQRGLEVKARGEWAKARSQSR